MSEECELCKLDRINHVFYNCDDFIIISCDSCNVPMAVPYEHIDPTEVKMLTGEETRKRHDLKKRMETELLKIAYNFFDDLEFYIDKKENKIPNHMHWHTRNAKDICCAPRYYGRRKKINQMKLKQIGVL